LDAVVSQLARRSVAIRRGGQVRIPWAEITAIGGVVLALAFLLREARPQDRAATLPLFPPTPILGPEPIKASGGQFLDLSQTQDDVREGVPAYHVSPILSGDGHSLTFFYTGDMQAAGDRNGLPDLFRYDLDRGQLEWVQSPANAGSFELASSMTSDGRLLAYSANLSSIYGLATLGDCGYAPCTGLALYGGSSGASEWLFSPEGASQLEAIKRRPYLTADGRYLAFFASSMAAVEPAGPSCGSANRADWAMAYVLDRTAQDLAALPFCAETDQAAAGPSIEISFDGRFLLLGGKLEPALQGDDARRSELAYLLFDRTSGQILDFPHPDGGSQSEARILEAHFARGSNKLVFSTPTPGLDSADANSYVDLYLWDLEGGSLELISAAPSGRASNGHSGSRFTAGSVAPTREFAVSSDGRFVVFVSQATDIVPGLSVDCGEFFRRACGNIFLRDRAAGITRLLVQEPYQEAYFTDLSIADDGDRVVFLEQRFGCYPAGYCTRMWVHDVGSGRTYDPLSGEDYSRDWAAGNFGSDQSGVVYPSIVFISVDTSISCQAVSPDGRMIAVGTTSGRIQVRDAASGRILIEQAYQHLPVFDLEFTPGGEKLYAVSRDGSLARIDLASGEIELTTYETPARFQAMALAPSGELIALAGQEELWLLRIIDGDLKLVQFKRFEHGPLRALAFSPDASLLAVGDGDGQVWVLDLDSEQSLLRLAGHTGRVLVVEFSRDGRLLASSGEDRVLNLWRLHVAGGVPPSAERVFSALHPEWVGDIEFAPDANFMVGVDFGHRVRFYPTDDFGAAQPGPLIAGGVLLNVAFSPDGEALYLASASSVVRIERQHWQEALR